ncbi:MULTISPECIES: hypothetical protein [Lonsdalea]|nr:MULTISPECIES: hypothetical protein [Lonsdalea]QPQ24298.1 hypothetical protein I6N93_00260 [Lonsdalea populi]
MKHILQRDALPFTAIDQAQQRCLKWGEIVFLPERSMQEKTLYINY